ncbi:Uu.00g142690.m01.CDS01 [Anthostomella pinea]|uniref:Uu.00g142690.m01.CDS01 n=1 Tax=Anthostomella pinea TaxID=933095 RepID=A0AAI8YLG7_9PEZI|nr:Uu.00g142690.m01.CDS01 [Anthostomella pinea]
MASKYANGASNGSANSRHTVTALSRWSILNKQLPAVDKINAIHVYDFDNTLFQTPLPNPKLWNSPTLGQLGSPEIFVNGGWWHDSRILAATGDGVEREEKRGWAGWWNEKIVELVKLSMKEQGALCVLLTGRSERGFSELIKRIVTSKKLDFDMAGLKPEVGPNNERFRSTMHFKQGFLEAMMETYKGAQEIRIYEDRQRHVSGFKAFLADYNERLQRHPGTSTRGPIVGEVIQVPEIATSLDPVVEVAEVQHLVNSHNAIVDQERGRGERLAIRKTVFFTSYMMQPEDTKRLIKLAAPSMPNGDLKYHANTIIITPRACPKHILDKIGGMNAKMKWEATGIGSWDNSIWAVSVRPVPDNAKYHTDQANPMVVIATRRSARPSDANKIRDWQPLPPDSEMVFETVVGEKVMLRIEPEQSVENGNSGLSSNRGKRKYPGGDEDGRPRNSSGNYGNNSRGYHSGYQGRGGNQRAGFRGAGAANRGYRASGRGGKGSGRGGRGNYKSLDDVGPRENQGAFGSHASVSYDDSFPSLGSQGGNGYQSQAPQYGQPFQQQGGGHWQGPGGGSGGFGSGGHDAQNFY